MRLYRTALALSLLIPSACSVAQASLLEPDAISRYVYAYENSNYLPSGTDRKDGVGVSPFSARAVIGYASAKQTSTITETKVLVSGSTYAYGDYEEGNEFIHSTWTTGHTYSYFYETFTIPASMSYDVSFSWSIPESDYITQTGLYLKGPGGTIFQNNKDDGNYGDPGAWSQSGTLIPGQYELSISSYSFAYDNWWGGMVPHNSFSVELTLTPEPMTAMSFGLAAAFICRRKLLSRSL